MNALIYIYHCYTHVESYQWPHHPLIFSSSFFFLFLTFIIPILKRRKKKKKKKLFFFLLVHIYCYTSSNISPLFASLSLHYSLLYRYNFFIFFSFLYFGSSFSYFILCQFNTNSLIQSIFFPQKNCEYSLSLSLQSDKESNTTTNHIRSNSNIAVDKNNSG